MTFDLDRIVEVARLFLRLGLTAFGGPAAHISLIERECVRQRGWMSHQQFLDVLGVANLIPGPTSTELAMHVGRLRAGWAGLVVAGLAFITPSALLVGALAAVYVRTGELAVTRGVLTAVQPVVIVIVASAVVVLARSAIRSTATGVIAVGAVLLALAGVDEVAVLILAGFVHLLGRRVGVVGCALFLIASPWIRAAADAMPPAPSAVFWYFARIGSLLFGSGYVLWPILHDDLVERLGWLGGRQLLEAIAAGQATPGPVFTTATFVGYILGGPWVAFLATVGIFLPAFIFSAASSVLLERLRASAAARSFLEGVNAAAVSLIGLVLLMMAQQALRSPLAVAVGVAAALLIAVAGVGPTIVLAVAALAGGLTALF